MEPLRSAVGEGDIMDPHPEQIDRHLEEMAEADAADARIKEYEHLRAMVDLADLAYYTLNTEACTPDKQQPATQSHHSTHQSHNPSTINA